MPLLEKSFVGKRFCYIITFRDILCVTLIVVIIRKVKDQLAQ